jgi:hypothetical protein
MLPITLTKHLKRALVKDIPLTKKEKLLNIIYSNGKILQLI